MHIESLEPETREAYAILPYMGFQFNTVMIICSNRYLSELLIVLQLHSNLLDLMYGKRGCVAALCWLNHSPIWNGL